MTGLCYTARPMALKYIALGEVAVFFMFGPLMVMVPITFREGI